MHVLNDDTKTKKKILKVSTKPCGLCIPHSTLRPRMNYRRKKTFRLKRELFSYRDCREERSRPLFEMKSEKMQVFRVVAKMYLTNTIFSTKMTVFNAWQKLKVPPCP